MRNWSQAVGSLSSHNGMFWYVVCYSQFIDACFIAFKIWLSLLQYDVWFHLLGDSCSFMTINTHEVFKTAFNMCCQVVQILGVSKSKYLKMVTTWLERAKESRKYCIRKQEIAGAFRPGKVRGQWPGFRVSDTWMGQVRYVLISFKRHERLRGQILFEHPPHTLDMLTSTGWVRECHNRDLELICLTLGLHVSTSAGSHTLLIRHWRLLYDNI